MVARTEHDPKLLTRYRLKYASSPVPDVPGGRAVVRRRARRGGAGGHGPAGSPWLYRINAGSCNGCDVELATTALIPRYDVERLGCVYCGSPRHADIVLITGPLTRHVLAAAQRVFAEIPDPKVTVAVGVCPITGGIFRESYAICAPIDQYFPVDVNVPGCPPRPPAIIEGVAKAIAIWRQRL